MAFVHRLQVTTNDPTSTTTLTCITNNHYPITMASSDAEHTVLDQFIVWDLIHNKKGPIANVRNRYYKCAAVQAKEVAEDTTVVTYVNGDTSAESRIDLKKGDIHVINPDGEQYGMSRNKFLSKYEVTEDNPITDQFQFFDPKGEAFAIQVKHDLYAALCEKSGVQRDEPLPKEILFWPNYDPKHEYGGMLLTQGDWLVCAITDGDDHEGGVYRVEGTMFAHTYAHCMNKKRSSTSSDPDPKRAKGACDDGQ